MKIWIFARRRSTRPRQPEHICGEGPCQQCQRDERDEDAHRGDHHRREQHHVFDNRVAVNHDLQKGSYDQCHACRMPITEDEKLKAEYMEGVSCHHCIDNVSDEQRERFAERQKQIELAQARGEGHIGNEAQAILQQRKEAKNAKKQAQRSK